MLTKQDHEDALGMAYASNLLGIADWIYERFDKVGASESEVYAFGCWVVALLGAAELAVGEGGTPAMNTDPDVLNAVARLWRMAYDDNPAMRNPVAEHPAIRMAIQVLGNIVQHESSNYGIAPSSVYSDDYLACQAVAYLVNEGVVENHEYNSLVLTFEDRFGAISNYLASGLLRAHSPHLTFFEWECDLSEPGYVQVVGRYHNGMA